MTGLFIVLEGIDGAGKSTLGNRIKEVLTAAGRNVTVTQEPTHDEIGGLIRSGTVKGISQAAEALLFVADRAVHTERISELINNGHDVICDRYFASTVAYQSAPLNGVALDKDWLVELNLPVMRDPDATFLLDIDPDKGMGRIAGREEKSKFEEAEYLGHVRARYLELAEEFGFKVIDASKDRNEVFAEVMASIQKLIKR
ncbi:MAG: dTMP kinase [Candidatus Methanoplasma sp.]|nr:dTMP kinase [Candidatus Methanoplasma sp.]